MKNIIVVTETEHANTLNVLAEEGKIEPVTFVTPNGETWVANSMWAATEWLIRRGYRSPDYKNMEFNRIDIKFL